MYRSIMKFVVLSAVLSFSVASQALTILLVNDDGWSAPGIQAMYKGLNDAGHDVTMVAPATQQSGKGGSMSSEPGHYIEVKRHRPGQWSVASTPGDSVRAGLDVIMQDNPPDLVISGSNFGQNLGRPTSYQSGTVNAAMQASFRGVPAIAISTGVSFAEARSQFPSTLKSFDPTAQLMVELLREMSPNGKLALPAGIVLNINVPVPFQGDRQLKLAPLSDAGGVEMIWQVGEKAFAEDGGVLQVGIKTDPVKPLETGDDVSLYNQGFVTVSVLSSDVDCVTSPPAVEKAVAAINSRVKTTGH